MTILDHRGTETRRKPKSKPEITEETEVTEDEFYGV